MADPRLRGPITRLLARTFVRGWQDPSDSRVALRLGLMALTVTVTVNALLFGIKLGFGLAIGSLALIADALDTLGDVALDAVGLVGFFISLRGPDPEHPYGHERAEEIAGLAVATVLVLVGLAFGYEAGRRLLRGEFGGAFSWLAIAAALSSVVGKYAISRFTFNLADYTGSPLLRVSGWHYFTDVFSGLLAAVAIGARAYGIDWLDPLFALVIALMLVYVAAHVFRDTSNSLLGRGGSPELLDSIHRTACNTPGVVGCADIEVHWYGRKKRVSLRIKVPDTLTLRDSHDIAHRVQDAIHAQHADWEPIVHVEPVPTDTEALRELRPDADGPT
jgi:ferrous-iron efflux pump FieF